METKNLSFNAALEMMENPKHDTLIFWHAPWSAPSVYLMRNLDKMPEIADVKVYKIDIENPPIETSFLHNLKIVAMPTTFFLKKENRGVYKKKAGNLSYDEILKMIS